jgi:hypothetical protein
MAREAALVPLEFSSGVNRQQEASHRGLVRVLGKHVWGNPPSVRIAPPPLYMKWKEPPIIKIYEALGAVADGRVMVGGTSAKVFSSSGNKFYTVTYDHAATAIMANDNGSYWKGYLGYPGIAYLLKAGILSYKDNLGQLLKGIHWKDLNQQFKNDFDKTTAHIFSKLDPIDQDNLKTYAEGVLQQIRSLNLQLLGKKQLPPDGY